MIGRLRPLALIAAFGATARGQTPDERAVARDLLTKHSDAVVSVMATAHIRLDMGGRDQTSDQTLEANATVIDPSGLIVTSLSALHPEEAMQRMGARMGASAPQISSELSDLRVHLADGREVPVKMMLRDEDLDLAFLKPVDPAQGWPAVPPSSGKLLVMDLVISLRRANEINAWSPMASFSYVQLVVERPRRYYTISGGLSMGSSVFDASGRWVGLAVMHSQGGRQMPSVITADDIREVARQVPPA